MPAARSLRRRLFVLAGLAAVVAGCGERGHAPAGITEGRWRYAGESFPATGTAAGAPAAPIDVRAAAPTAAAPAPIGPQSPAASPAPAAPTPTPSTASSSGSTYKVVEVKNGGSIHVVCRISNPPAELDTVVAFKHRDLGCTDHKNERCRFVRKGDGDVRLGNCVITLRGVRAGKDWPEPLRGDDRTYLIDQKACVYLPHVGWTRPSTQVVVVNSDRADHNIHGNRGSDTKFNFASEPDTRKDTISDAFLEIPDQYFVKCDIHPWMNAYIHVVTTPYVAITSDVDGPAGPAGEVTLDDVPPGTYDVVCWHEGMMRTVVVVDGKPSGENFSADQVKSTSVTVAAGERKDVEFTLEHK